MFENEKPNVILRQRREGSKSFEQTLFNNSLLRGSIYVDIYL